MNITIDNKELTINTVNDLMEAQGKLLEAFASSLLGTRESIRKEVEREILQSAGYDPDVYEIDDLSDWLLDMSKHDLVGKDTEEIREEVLNEALSDTEYDSIEEMQEAIEEFQRVLQNVANEISDYV